MVFIQWLKSAHLVMTVELILNFARSQAAAGNLDQAAAAFERAAQLQPRDCNVLNDWGV